MLSCIMRQPFELLHALGGPKLAGQIARLLPACCGRGAAGMTADSHSHPRPRYLVGVVAPAALRSLR